MNYDVFNGDADGLCAIRQLLLAMPLQATAITGLKRDHKLLKQVKVQRGDHVTVADISLYVNRKELLGMLNAGAYVRWFDHHFSDKGVSHANFDAHISEDGNTCSSLIVYHYLRERGHCVNPGWALTGAFGDGMDATALHFAKEQSAQQKFTRTQLESLRELGVLLNYNSYGETLGDVCIHPRQLYDLMRRYEDPFEFMHNESRISTIRDVYHEDFARAVTLPAATVSATGAVYMLPDGAPSRRISGPLANHLLREHPNRAHAVVVPLSDSTWRVSVRSPLNLRVGADV